MVHWRSAPRGIPPLKKVVVQEGMADKRRLTTTSITSFFPKKPRTASPKIDSSLTLPEPLHLTSQSRCELANAEWCSQHVVPEDPDDCCASDFFYRDPAVRPPNLFRVRQLSQKPSLLSQVLRLYAREGPHQPKDVDFKGSSEGGSSRSFQANWYNTYPWLEYSPTSKAAYCLCCYLSREVMMMDKERSPYCQPSLGYKNWKKATSKAGFMKHVDGNGSKHRMAELALADRLSAASEVRYFLLIAATLFALANGNELSAATPTDESKTNSIQSPVGQQSQQENVPRS